jgi:hypothetical protein
MVDLLVVVGGQCLGAAVETVKDRPNFNKSAAMAYHRKTVALLMAFIQDPKCKYSVPLAR